MPSGETQPCQMDMRPLANCVDCCVVNVFVIFLTADKEQHFGVIVKRIRAHFQNSIVPRQLCHSEAPLFSPH